MEHTTAGFSAQSTVPRSPSAMMVSFFGRTIPPIVIFVLLLFGTYWFLFSQSHKAVSHGIHAIEVAPDQFIHGSYLDCTDLGPSVDCRIDLDGQLLTVRARNIVPTDNFTSIRSCDARFAGRNIGCTADYPTSSYWSHGVSVDSAELRSVMAQTGSMPSARALLLGTHEGHALLMLVAAVVLIPTLSVVVVPYLLSNRRMPIRSQITVGRVGVMMAMAFVTLVFVAYMLLALGFAD